MWALALKLIGLAIGWFFPAKDERDVERQAGEKAGQQEAENAGLTDYIKTEQAIKDAVDKQPTDTDSVWNDPNNRDKPAKK